MKTYMNEKNTQMSNVYNSFANIYSHKKDEKHAIEYYLKALNGELEYRYKSILYANIGDTYKKVKNYEKAYNYAKKSSSLFLEELDKVFQVLSQSSGKELFLQKNNAKVPLLLETAYLYMDDNATRSTFTSWLSYKGSIFDSENAIVTLYANTTDKALKKKIDDLVSSKRILAKLYQTLPKPKERQIWQSNIKRSEEKIATLTKEIAAKAQSFKEQQGLKNISYTDIAKHLKKEELYIDYAKAGENYYVFTLDSNEHIAFEQIDTNSTVEIDTLVKTFREDIDTILNTDKLTDTKLQQLTIDSKKKLSRLYTLLLSNPLQKELKGKKSLILSPDGALKLLPFEALYDKAKEQYFIEEKDIRYIPSGKELVRLYKYGQSIKNNNKQAVIFDNPDFDAKDISQVPKKKETEEEIPLTPNTSRAGIIKSLFKMRFNPLPGTKAEAESIKTTLKEDTKIQEYKEQEATEANLLQVKRPTILHIATHGFFINDNSIPNPMLKSGIALSGANTSAIRGKSDGIVTALKLSGLKLKGTELVVLSACQTGVVDINSTDSVSGLSKAFIQAGAKDIVMSLWSVNDQATKELMSSFYKQMQTQPNYATALKQAKLKMIEQGMHPFFWAPFVLSGL